MAAFWSDAVQMTTSGLIVAAAAVPVGLAARAVRPRGEPLLPQWKPWRVPWNGFEVAVAFLMVSYVLPLVVLQLLSDAGFYQRVYGQHFPTPRTEGAEPERLKEAATLRMLWANVLALPLQLGSLWAAVRALYPAWRPAIVGRGSSAGKVWLAVLAWLALAPAVLAFNAVVNVAAEHFDVTPEQHSLTALGGRPLMDRVLFLLEACVGAPLREELIFRGLLLAWCARRIKFPGEGLMPLTAARPWLVMSAALPLAFLLGGGRTGPVAFAAVLALGLGVLWRLKRTGARRARAVYATAALFAVVHSGVWPSPVPLFALGLGLGWLAVRTNGVLVPTIVHGLFNAVSAVFVLRG
ncbi:MAG: CPBP family intramembrane metalloprotease [Planctomycetes bacterium]|nr:CPBP family intramembrane metalloprotease [Planctomycetota bacterium]